MKSTVPLRFGAVLLASVFTVTLPAQLALHSAKPPFAEKKPKDVSIHGDARTDDYFWLREKNNPAVLEHLRAENAYTDAVMAPTAPLREALFQEMVARIQETDASAPYPDGQWSYYSRTEKGKQYRIYCRKALNDAAAPEQVLLDLNVLGAGKKFIGLGHFEVSDNGERLAYTIDLTGHRDYELFVKDLKTGSLIPQSVGTVSSVEWAADNDTLFFTKEDPVSKRSNQLGRCVLATKKVDLQFEEKDEMFDLELSRSDDRAFVFCTSTSKQTSDVRAVPSASPESAWRVLVPRETDHRYFANHGNGRFYFRTNKAAKNFRIVTAPDATPDVSHWTEFVAHQEAVNVGALRLFANFAVISEREGGLPFIRAIDLTSKQSHRIAFPEPAFDASLATNADYNTTQLRYNYESPVTAPSVFAYDLSKRTGVLVKQTAVLGGYHAADYTCERILVPASDATLIPVTLVYRKNLRRKGAQPLWLYGYGSYGISMPANFSSARLSLLDRGMIYAIAHVRGGGELGEPWREAGRMEHKMTTFTDFISCAEHLIKTGYTSPSQLATSGGSAGGLLMGAVLNLRPGLFKVAVAKVPFVDILNTMLDASLPLTTAEYIEWGNPNVKAEYAWMRSYSPYDNLGAKAYPSLLVTTSLNDSQVPYWEGAKFVAKMRTLKTDDNPLLLKIELDPAGHGGASGRYDSLKLVAFDYAFVLTTLGLDQPVSKAP